MLMVIFLVVFRMILVLGGLIFMGFLRSFFEVSLCVFIFILIIRFIKFGEVISLMDMYLFEEVIEIKGFFEFMRSELVGIFSFRFRRMLFIEVKKVIEEWIEEGFLEESEGKFFVVIEKLEEEKEVGFLFGEMVFYIVCFFGWGEFEVLEGVKKMCECYGDFDEVILVYLFGMEKGVDMLKFRDRFLEF